MKETLRQSGTHCLTVNVKVHLTPFMLRSILAHEANIDRDAHFDKKQFSSVQKIRNAISDVVQDRLSSLGYVLEKMDESERTARLAAAHHAMSKFPKMRQDAIDAGDLEENY